MVTSNKAWVGSLPPFLPRRFLASPTPTSPTWWPALAVVGSGECVSPGRLRSPVSGLWPSQAVGSWLWPPRSAGLRAAIPGTAAAVAPQAGWLLGTASKARRSAYRSLRFGYWCICPGGGDHLCKLMNDGDVGFTVQNGSTFCFVQTGSRKQGSGETLECQLGCPHPLRIILHAFPFCPCSSLREEGGFRQGVGVELDSWVLCPSFMESCKAFPSWWCAFICYL